MFVEFLNEDKTIVKALESAKSCGGLCERPYEVLTLKARNYKPLRYKNIVDG